MERLHNLAARLIAMAVSLVGDADAVRKAMACSEADFEAYRAGSKAPSQEQFERLVGVIIHEQGNLIAAKRDLLAQNSGQGEASPRQLGPPPRVFSRLLVRHP